jgi:hypothetical protein
MAAIVKPGSRHVELNQIEQAVLLGDAEVRALLNGTVVGRVSGLSYFRSALQEVRSLQTPEGYWHNLAIRVAKFERLWSQRAKRKISGVP